MTYISQQPSETQHEFVDQESMESMVLYVDKYKRARTNNDVDEQKVDAEVKKLIIDKGLSDEAAKLVTIADRLIESSN